MYKVIRYFTDLQDNNYEYRVGDRFPRHGIAVSADRIAELSSCNNLQNTQLIEVISEVNENSKRKRNKKADE